MVHWQQRIPGCCTASMALEYNTMQMQCNAIQCNQYNAMQCNTIQYNTSQGLNPHQAQAQRAKKSLTSSPCPGSMILLHVVMQLVRGMHDLFMFLLLQCYRDMRLAKQLDVRRTVHNLLLTQQWTALEAKLLALARCPGTGAARHGTLSSGCLLVPMTSCTAPCVAVAKQ